MEMDRTYRSKDTGRLYRPAGVISDKNGWMPFIQVGGAGAGVWMRPEGVELVPVPVESFANMYVNESGVVADAYWYEDLEQAVGMAGSPSFRLKVTNSDGAITVEVVDV